MRQLKIAPSVTGRMSRSLEIYFKEISKKRMLSQDEETELVKKIREGDPRAKEKLVTANLRFVISVAKQYQHRGLSLPDLIEEGNLGLIKAAGRFDETKGFKFISYAVWWIRQFIVTALENQAEAIRIPRNKTRVLNTLRKAASVFEQEHEREPTLEELSKVSDLSLEMVNNVVQLPGRIVSLDEPRGLETEKAPLITFINDPNAVSGDVYIHQDSLKTDLKRVLSRLHHEENTILRLLYGIGVRREYSPDEVGRRFELTGEKVCRIKEKAIRKMKNYRDVLLKYNGVSNPVLG